MPAEKTERSCAICIKRHETGNPRAALECRALPPIQGLARDAGYPVVTAAHYCHLHFVEDPDAVKARKAELAATGKLDDKVEATQTAEAGRLEAIAAAAPPLIPGEPMKDAPDVELPPPGDGPPKKGRARRARSDVAQKSLL